MTQATKASRPPRPPKGPTTPPPGTKAHQKPDDGAARAVTLAAVIGAHGVAGEVRLKVFAEDLAAHRSFNGGALTLVSLREGSNGAIARFAEVADRNAAEALRGTELRVSRDALPPLGEGEYYHADLIGLPVEAEDGTAIGTVVAVDNYGAGDVIEIERADGTRFMVPMTEQAVPRWSETALVVAPGWFEG